MSCAPEQVTAYVDDALDPEGRAAMEAHLASCADCREQEAFERSLRSRLREIPTAEPGPDLEARVRRRLVRERPRRFSWPLPLAASLVVLALWGRGAAPFVAWELSRDHAHCFGQGRLPAKVWSNDPGEVTRWFEDQGTRLPPIPATVGELGLVGARYCPLLDRYAAHLYYAGEERHLSVFVLSGPVRFHESWSTESRGRTVSFLHSAGTTVALVSARTEDVDAFRATFMTTVAAADRSGPTRTATGIDRPHRSW